MTVRRRRFEFKTRSLDSPDVRRNPWSSAGFAVRLLSKSAYRDSSKTAAKARLEIHAKHPITGIAALSLAVNRSLTRVQKRRFEFAQCR